jgi:hypothetical protein
VFGTAAQLAAVACLSQKAGSLHGGVLNAKDSLDLILAAIGLLNVKMALIACFAMLMFVLFIMSFLYNKCDTKKFVSWKGSITFNIWALIYETIETSTVDIVLKFLCSGSDEDEPEIRDCNHSRWRNSGSASLGFPTDKHHPCISPKNQARRVSPVLTGRCAELNDIAPAMMETMETTFVNEYGFDFQASRIAACSMCFGTGNEIL